MKNISLREQFDMIRRVVDKPTAKRSNRILMSFQSKYIYLRSKCVQDPFFYQLLYETYIAKAERAFSDKTEPEYKELETCLKGLIRLYYNESKPRYDLESSKETHLLRAKLKAREMFYRYSNDVREELFKMAEHIRKNCKFPNI